MLSHLVFSNSLVYSHLGMSPRFDIFKIDGGLSTWLECVETVKACRERLLELQIQYPNLLVWDSIRDTKYSVKEFLAIGNGEGELSLSDLEHPL